MAQPEHRGEYPADWRKIANSIKSSACWQCERCGRAHDTAAGYCLTVHHFDGDKGNCERWNLMALCQRCHLSVQARVNPAVPIMFDPSPWSMPHIAGLYEAGGCVPSPGYDLQRWIEDYERVTLLRWPSWAPRPGKDGAK